MVGGFEDPTEGRVYLGGDEVTQLPPYKRDVNTVFQSYALFPHLTRREERRVRARAQEDLQVATSPTRVGEALEMVQLGQLRQAQAGAALRRPAAARGARPRAGEPPAGAAARRAARRARPAPAQAAADRAQAHPAGRRHHVRARHARPGGGHEHGRHDRRDERRQDRAGRRRRRPLRAPEHRVRRQLPRRLQPRRRPPARLAERPLHGRDARRRHPERAVATGSARTAPTPSASASGPRRSPSPPPAPTWPTGHNVLRGTVVVASFLGVSIQYVIRAAGGEELTVFAQNLDGAEPESLGPGREVQLAWDPQHTFVVAKEGVT